jgi:superoxide dismutase, Fe-Mn family
VFRPFRGIIIDMKHELPELGYGYDALEPYVDARTMEVHYSKHHATYVNKLNDALSGYSQLQDKPISDLLKDVSSLPDAVRGAVMGKDGRGEAVGTLRDAITKDFGGFDKFREEFTKVANGGFGSGYAWLVKNNDQKLSILWTPNQDSPVSMGLTPILTVDAWEHSYYLKYQNRRPEYIEAWWSVVDWKKAEKYFTEESSIQI